MTLSAFLTPEPITHDLLCAHALASLADAYVEAHALHVRRLAETADRLRELEE